MLAQYTRLLARITDASDLAPPQEAVTSLFTAITEKRHPAAAIMQPAG